MKEPAHALVLEANTWSGLRPGAWRVNDAADPAVLSLASEPGASDEELLRRHHAGDVSAFRELVLRHQGWVHGYLASRTGCPDAARDLAQDVFLRAFRGSPGFRFRARFSTWLFSITENVRRRHAARTRRDRARRARAPNAVAGPAPDPLASVADDRPGPEEHLASRERAERVRLAMKTLSAGQQRALILVKVQGLSVASAARTLGVTDGRVKTWLHRGRLALAQALAEGGPR